ncbi:ABC transporter substrate-binding protein [Candidatus Auribacterota bacterium]
MKKILIIIFLICLIPVALAAQDSPKRIISLGPFVTEEIFLLGAEDQLVGCTNYCKQPPEAMNKEKVGTIQEANVEKIAILSPDIVLATNLTNPRAADKLRSLGIEVKRFPLAKDFDEMCSQFIDIGKIVGKEETARQLTSESRKKVEAIKERVKDLKHPRIFVQVGTKPLFTISKDSFVNSFVENAGGINIASDAGIGFFNMEEVIRRNPDIILIISMGIAAKEEKTKWMKYKTMNAARDDRIYIIDSYALCSPTPVSFAETLADIAELIHPGSR